MFANGSAQRATGNASAEFRGYIPRSASWGISLAREKVNLRMNWTYLGRSRGAAFGAGTSIEPGTYNWKAKRGLLDVLGEYNFTKRMAAYANFRNINDTPEDSMAIGPSTPRHAQLLNRNYGGSLWTFGLKCTF